MSTRRTNNNIRGPHSALTDFLAANNISARQIRDDYERRRREAAEAEVEANGGAANGDDGEEMDVEEVDAILERSRREQEKEKRKKEKEKLNGKKGGKKAKKGKKKGDDDEANDASDSDYFDAIPSYKKAKKMPGQLANCEVCEKRFTVTPYSKTGPDGGLLCLPCGKELDKEAKNGDKRKADKKAVKPGTKRRRGMASERLDGIVRRGAKSLVDLSLETVVKYHDDLESFENMPEHLVSQICNLFTKRRIMSSNLFPLFLQKDTTKVMVYDCASMFNIISVYWYTN
jgi:DNA repair protein RAD7